MSATSVPATGPALSKSSPLYFSGQGGDFFRLLVNGSLLQIPTLGFYRFWLITKIRRHLWSSTQVAGEPFEYTGTAKELLLGFLIAIAILTPIYLAYAILAFALEEQHALASAPLVLIMYVLAHFGVYRARRYRATRTVFRGIRFWMKGRGWAYAARAILWDVATVLTLGLALPWASASLERYRMRHTYFGTIQGDFVGTGWVLFKRSWWTWALGLAGLVGGVAVMIRTAKSSPDTVNVMGGIVTLGVLLIIVGLAPAVMAIKTRWQLEGLRFGDVAVASNLSIGAFYGTFIKLILSSLGFLLAFGLVVSLGGGMFAGIFKRSLAQASVGGFNAYTVAGGVGIALAYLVLLLGLGVIQRYFMGRGLWERAVQSLWVSNLDALDAAAAAGEPVGATGEGLADALDFSVGI
ncbi:DUF898 domain-containing protein [Microvirga puerhi]|uniref:DUF898 domain-containing protein n=1 Tax=Microvirga puerhi TaxID=2876078 RepID=A0ABS7VMR7_9HYPH|nr:DUF898 domain-containing protein [Microvirga puerhi]MBZ6076238.1 DUF898 domain-containing protein [Microvirga puerhi]